MDRTTSEFEKVVSIAMLISMPKMEQTKNAVEQKSNAYFRSTNKIFLLNPLTDSNRIDLAPSFQGSFP